LDNLGHYPAGITFGRLIPSCVDQILAAADHKPANWAAFLDDIQPANNPYAEDDLGAEWSLYQDIVRGAGRSDEKFCAPELAWKAVKLLAIRGVGAILRWARNRRPDCALMSVRRGV
jgi:hypothetical protein